MGEEDYRGEHIVSGQVADGNLVQPVREPLGGGPQHEGEGLHPDDQDGGQVDQAEQPAAARDEAALTGAVLREGEREVQKERRLQRARDDGAPVDRPVKGVQLAGVLEGVEDERCEAEDVEVRGVRARSSAGRAHRDR